MFSPIVLALAAALLITVVSPGVEAGERERVDIASVDAVTVLLSDGRRVTAAGIDPMTNTGFAGPLANLFRALVKSGPVDIVPLGKGPDETDRHGRIPALLARKGEDWLQLALLGSGLTRFTGFTVETPPGVTSRFLAAEAEARTARSGVWGTSLYSVFDADTVPMRDGFVVVEASPVAVARVGPMVYLNFGPDWKTDFTAGIRKYLLRTPAWKNWSLEELIGKRLRLRGWTRPYNGAFMTLTAPDQIEILPDLDTRN